MADLTQLGKKAEDKIRDWLDRPKEGYCFQRIPDQLSGFYGSSNICDFFLYKQPYFYFIESKSTYEDSFPFSMISKYQNDEMLKASAIEGVKCYVIVLFATYKRAFVLDIRDINDQIKSGGKKSINIKKIDKWTIPYIEINTIKSKKELLDYDRKFADKLF